MRKVTKFVLALCIIGLGTAEASFPVKKGNQTETVSETTVAPQQATEEMAVVAAEMEEASAKIEKVEKTSGFSNEDWILLVLWFFLGGLAAHRWYAKRPVGWNILFILTAGGCFVWAIIDLIKIIQQDFM